MQIYFINFFFLILTTSLSSQQTMGLFFNDERSDNGYTLFSNNETTYLIDNCGFKVNEWESDYKTNNGIFITSEGDLFRQGKLPGTLNLGGSGGVIEQYSWEGDLKWTYEIADNQFLSHHDMLQMPNGNLLVLVWEKISAAQAVQEGRVIPGTFYNEQVWEIQPLPNNQAKLVWKWSALDHIIQDKYANKSNFGVVRDHPELIDINFLTSDVDANADWLHVNSIDYNQAFDQLMISSRNTSEVYIIDHSTSQQEASGSSGGISGKGGDILYRYGNPQAYDHGDENDRLLHQAHDVGWIPYGEFANDFIIFNNNYIFNTRSRIQIWHNPTTDGHYNFSEESLFGTDHIIWSYDAIGFYSSRMSSAQVLANGNILTTEGTTGEISEITPNKEKVWKYINPANKNGGPGIQGGTPHFNDLFKATRYADNYEGFDHVSLIPGETVELSPDDIGCQIFVSTAIQEENKHQHLYSTSNQYIYWDDGNIPIGNLYIFDVLGRLCIQTELSITTREVDISALPTGAYILKTDQLAGSLFFKN